MKTTAMWLMLPLIMLAFSIQAMPARSSASAQAEIAEIKVSETITDLDWNDANQLLALGADDGVYLYTVDLQPVTYFAVHGDSKVVDVAWKPDGTQLATVG